MWAIFLVIFLWACPFGSGFPLQVLARKLAVGFSLQSLTQALYQRITPILHIVSINLPVWIPFSVLRSSQLSAISFSERWFKFSVLRSCQLSAISYQFFSALTHFPLSTFPFSLSPFTFFSTAENAKILRKERRGLKSFQFSVVSYSMCWWNTDDADAADECGFLILNF